MADVIAFPVKPAASPGNGAREALVEIGQDCPFHVEHVFAGNWADDVLTSLWLRGFKVVPLEPSDG